MRAKLKEIMTLAIVGVIVQLIVNAIMWLIHYVQYIIAISC